MVLKTAAIYSRLLTHILSLQSHLLHTYYPNLLQTVPQAAHTMRHNPKIDGVRSIELKCEELLNMLCKGKLNRY